MDGVSNAGILLSSSAFINCKSAKKENFTKQAGTEQLASLQVAANKRVTQAQWPLEGQRKRARIMMDVGLFSVHTANNYRCSSDLCSAL